MQWTMDWYSESHPPQLILVALKCDLRDDPATIEKLARQGRTTVVYEQGLAVARRINASRYLGELSEASLDFAELQ